ncbi:XrtA system polysaccharide deacetylase [Desulfogranum marinum]|uniref:XrtA system polysaccharide deacetylase n=1 Tax=Desulfogranum marinum TaxID=453220 RepID=UPI0029C708A6|nr:XrtA system polysaccharide deacetylase [Desulfogranum marinum]
MNNYLTIDVEDYFQVSAFEKNIKVDEWDNFESRVVNNTERILDILAEFETKATFFIVGWIAEKHPKLVRTIQRAGHPIGCHSYLHRKIYTLTPEQFREDTKRAKELLEEIIGQPILGYRAPSYSITEKSLWALEILAELGFEYDSSIFPVMHDNYGIPDSPRFPYGHQHVKLYEYPISTARILGRTIPVSGGGYFRLFPYWFTRWALETINNKEKQPYVFYLHPWEIDPKQPRFKTASFLSRFRHYNHLEDTENRLRSLLGDFSFEPLPETNFN